MEIIKNNWKSIIKYILLFVFILFFNLILYPINLDDIWNYGFAYNIAHGLIPYRDFNMVLTPLYSIIMAIPLLINSNVLTFYISHAIILTFCFYLCFRLLGNKTWLLLLFFFLPQPIIYPSYNVFLIVLFLLLVYLEENKKSNYLIGIVLGCFILTKQSVGVFVALVGILYYIKDRNVFIKRFVGCFLVCFIFLLYLLITKSLTSFLDLCFFGLFDFAKGNGNLTGIWFYLTIIVFIITVYFIIKNPKNIYNYYAITFYSVNIPLFDMYHFQILNVIFVFILLFNLKRNININYFLIFIVSIIEICLCLYNYYFYNKKIIYPNNINHFEYRYLPYDNINLTNQVNNYLNKMDNYNYMFLDSNGYYFKLIRNDKITYLDLINKGNWGYNGSYKLLKKIKSLPKNTLFFIDDSELSGQKQIDRNALKYVIKHGRKIKTIQIYNIYVIDK